MGARSSEHQQHPARPDGVRAAGRRPGEDVPGGNATPEPIELIGPDAPTEGYAGSLCEAAELPGYLDAARRPAARPGPERRG